MRLGMRMKKGERGWEGQTKGELGKESEKRGLLGLQ